MNKPFRLHGIGIHRNLLSNGPVCLYGSMGLFFAWNWSKLEFIEGMEMLICMELEYIGIHCQMGQFVCVKLEDIVRISFITHVISGIEYR